MQWVDILALSPSTEQLLLLKYLVILLSFIHIPFISMLMGGAFFSVLFNLSDKAAPNLRHRHFARQLMDTFAYNKAVGFILGVVPLLALTFLFAQILHGASAFAVGFLLTMALLATAGLILIYVYHGSFDIRSRNFALHIGAGAVGSLLLFGAYYLFVSSTSLILDPEKWSFIQTPQELLFSWNAIARYLHFMTACFAITGGGILFFFFKWSEEPHHDEAYSTFVKQFGAGVALAFTLFQPLFAVWNLYTLPDVALSNAVFGWAVFALFLLMLLSLALYQTLRNREPKFVTHVFVLLLAIFLAGILGEHASREHAIRQQTDLLIAHAEEAKEELQLARGHEATGPEAELKRGETVFNNKCSTCHRYDKRLVGPPFSMVLPSYQSDPEALMTFIRNPTKKSPDYPAMPNQGLKEIEVQAVAMYILKRLEDEQP